MNARLLCYGVAVFATLWPGRLEAGYSNEKLGIVGIPLGAEEATKEGLDLATSQGVGYPPIVTGLDDAFIARLRQFGEFKALPDNTVVKAKLIGTRIMVLCAIETIQLQYPELGACLAQLYRSGRICLGFASNLPAAASIDHDASKECGNEPINLYKFPCGKVPIYAPAFFALVNAMAHEAQHAMQEWYQGPRPATDDQRAHLLLIHQCNEAEASAAEFERLDALVGALRGIENNGTLPPSASGIAGRIGATILNDPGLPSLAQKQAAATKLRESVLDGRVVAQNTLSCRTAYKRALEIFLQGGPNRTRIYNEAIARTGWFHDTAIRDIAGFGAFQISYTAGGGRFMDGPDGPATVLEGSREFAQFGQDGHQEIFNVPDVEFVSDAFLYPNGKTVLVVGTAANGMGFLYGASDPDGNGYFDATTLTKVLESTALGGGLRFVWNPADHLLLGVNRSTGNIVSLGQIPEDSTVLPTMATPFGSMGLRGDLQEFWLGPDGDTLFGAPDLGSPLGVWDEYATSRFLPALDRFVPAGSFHPHDEAVCRPAFGELPTTTNFLSATGPANSLMHVWGRPPGAADPVLLASGRTSYCGSIIFNFPTPLAMGARLHLTSDGAPGMPSVFETVRSMPDLGLDIIRRPDRPGNHAPLLGFRGRPFQAGNVRRSHRLNDWADFQAARVGAFGEGVLDLGIQPPDESAFFTFSIQAETATPTADTFTIAPGVAYCGSVLGNDNAPPGTRVVLQNGPGLHPSLFNWSNDGKFEVTPLTSSGSLTFNYLLETVGGEKSTLVTVTITVQRPLLASLPPQPGLVDFVPVPCLLLPTPAPFIDAVGYYPMYQFILGNNAADVCEDPHWHAHVPVFFLPIIESDIGGRIDPAPPSCGFGLESDIPQAVVNVSTADWAAFLLAHPALP